MTIPQNLKDLDGVFLDAVSETLPEFADAAKEIRYDSIDEMHIDAFVMLKRHITEDLVDIILFSRDYDEDLGGFLFNLDFGVMKPGEEDSFMPPFKRLIDVLREEDPENFLLDCRVGAGWYLLGETLEECSLSIPFILRIYREFAMPVNAKTIKEHKNEKP